MRNTFLILLVFVITPNVLLAGELVLKGQYSGKNIFVRNPYNNITKSFCTNKIFVNDRLIFDSPMLTAFQVDLSYLKLGDLVVLRIEYKDDCEPVVLNPQALSFTSGFQFITAQSDNNSIHWSSKGELPNGRFEIEQLIKKKKEWKVVNTVTAKGQLNNNQYSIAPNHYPGDNHYRLKYIDREGKEFYSVEFVFTSTDEPITFTPETVTLKITLSKTTDYVISDMNGNEILKGKGKEIFVQDLKAGLYYLNIENRAERFVKK
ncbi:MAG: T9SS type A sorting domain-containing protein [Cyclobacteriaceae bacterium]|nr:T9SS type A sorting domain-containing protein [Cyclobacteriaceae bacterium]